jgi:CHAT domain-containing protein/tetratricopeptide (TPR) repeat protein
MPLSPQQMHDQLVLHLWNVAERDAGCFVSLAHDLLADSPTRHLGAFLVNAGLTFHDAAQHQVALVVAQAALEVFEQAADRAGCVRALINSGIYCEELLRFEESRRHFHRALEINDALGDKSLESKAYVGLGRLCNQEYAFDEAIANFERALPLKREIGDGRGLVTCLTGLGMAHHQKGDFTGAIAMFDEILALPDVLDGERVAALMNKGTSHLSLGQLREGLDHEMRAHALATEIADESSIGTTLNNIGIAYGYLGEYRKALGYCLRAVQHDIPRVERASCLQNIGNAHFNLDELPQAAEYLEQALELKTELQDWRGIALCNMNLGNVRGQSGDPARALQHHRAALDLAERFEDRYIAAQCHLNLGVTLVLLQRLDEAMREFEDSQAIGEDLCSAVLCVQSHSNLAMLARSYLQEPKRARVHCLKALTYSNEAGKAMIEDTNRLALASKAAPIFDTLIPVELDLHGSEEAWRALERSKARALVDLMRSSDVRPSASVPPGLVDRERRLLTQLRTLQTTTHTSAGASAESSGVQQLLGELEEVHKMIRQIDPEYVSLRDDATAGATEVAGLLAETEGAVLVEYCLLPDRVLAFILGGGHRTATVITVGASRSVVESLVVRYHQAVSTPPSRAADKERVWLRERLSQVLVQPVADSLREARLLVCVPTRSLHYLPMSTLLLDGEPLLRHLAVAYAPSATVLSFLSRRSWSGPGRVAALGTQFKEEAETVATMFGAEPFVGPAATVQRFLRCCRENDTVHFAGHGYFDQSDALSSGLVLHDGLLTAREILMNRMRAGLVTLGACQTGVSETTGGDDVIGLVRAFLHAGAASLVASLWKVESNPTQTMMEAFYRGLRDGRSRMAALHDAQLVVAGEYGAPFFWAPFLLFGSWS